MDRRRVRIFGALAVVAIIVALVLSYWPSTSSRTDRILDVYADQMNITREEAEVVREDALATAEFICSIPADELEERLRQTTTDVFMAVDMADAACPELAREFRRLNQGPPP